MNAFSANNLPILTKKLNCCWNLEAPRQPAILTPLELRLSNKPTEPFSLKCIQTRVTIVTKIADLPPICIDVTFDRGRRDVKLTCLKPAADKSTHFTKIFTIAIWLAKCEHSSKTFIHYHLFNHTQITTDVIFYA